MLLFCFVVHDQYLNNIVGCPFWVFKVIFQNLYLILSIFVFIRMISLMVGIFCYLLLLAPHKLILLSLTDQDPIGLSLFGLQLCLAQYGAAWLSMAWHGPP